jgi:hypothetical protein
MAVRVLLVLTTFAVLDLASRLPDANLHRLKNTGHLSIQRHYGTMLDTLLPE